jgi:hypothetical protein
LYIPFPLAATFPLAANIFRPIEFELTSFFSPGAPHPNFSKGIHDEHCVFWGFDVQFTTSNYGLTTTPQKEYGISTGKHLCPEEDMKDKKGRRVRVIRRIEELKRLKLCRKAHLTDDEILTVVRALHSTHHLYEN